MPAAGGFFLFLVAFLYKQHVSECILNVFLTQKRSLNLKIFRLRRQEIFTFRRRFTFRLSDLARTRRARLQITNRPATALTPQICSFIRVKKCQPIANNPPQNPTISLTYGRLGLLSCPPKYLKI